MFRLPAIRKGGLASLEGEEITDAAVNAARCVLSAVRRSSNLKGGHVKIMKDGVAFAMAAVRELAGRVADSEGGARVAALKKELALARRQIAKLKEEVKRGEVDKASSDKGGDTTVPVACANAREVPASRDAATSPMALRPERSFMPTFASVAKATTASPRRGRERGESVPDESLRPRGKKSVNPLLLPPARRCRSHPRPRGKNRSRLRLPLRRGK